MFYANTVMLSTPRLREVDFRYLVFIAHVFANSNKTHYIDTFYGRFLIPFIKIKAINKLQIKIFG